MSSADSCMTPVFSKDMDASIRSVHEKLQLIGQSKLGTEIMDNYEQLMEKLRQAVKTLHSQESDQSFADFEHFLGTSNLDIPWLLKKIPHFMDSVDVRQVNCKVLSTDGFVSQIVRVVIADNNGSATSIIIKMPETRATRNALVAAIGTDMANDYWPLDQENERISGMMKQFNREIDFYTLNDIEGLKIPNIFYSQKWESNVPGALLMEDLCHLKSVSFFESLKLGQIEQVAEQLKVLHLYSRDPSPIWKETFTYPEGALGLLKHLQPVVSVFVERFPELKEMYNKFSPLYANSSFVDFIMLESHKDLGLPDVICHGDLWTYNFLWEIDENQNESERLGAIIDWQNPHAGSVGEDFAHMLVFCCSPEIRREAERIILPRHFQKISCLTEKFPNFTFDKFMRAYRRQVVMHALHLPFIANVMLRYKTIRSEEERERYTRTLLDRIQGAWEDAWVIVQEELPQWL